MRTFTSNIKSDSTCTVEFFVARINYSCCLERSILYTEKDIANMTRQFFLIFLFTYLRYTRERPKYSAPYVTNVHPCLTRNSNTGTQRGSGYCPRHRISLMIIVCSCSYIYTTNVPLFIDIVNPKI